jgi:hypothetical protein
MPSRADSIVVKHFRKNEERMKNTVFSAKSILTMIAFFPSFAFASPKIVCLGQTDDFGLQVKTTLEDLSSSSVVISYAMIQGSQEAVLVSRAHADVSLSGCLFIITGTVETASGNREKLPIIKYDSSKRTLLSDGGRDAGLETSCVLN